MPGTQGLGGGCCCGGGGTIPASTIAVTVRGCGGGPIFGAQVTILAPDGSVASTGTTDVTGRYAYGNVTVSGVWTASVQAAGYVPNPAIGSTTFPQSIFASTRSVPLALSPGQVHLTVNAQTCYQSYPILTWCFVPGASITVSIPSLDFTGTGTTPCTFDVPVPTGQAGPWVGTVVGTPPSGYGCDPGSVSGEFSIALCVDLTPNLVFPYNPANSKPLCCAARFLPTTLNYSDDYGSCDVTSPDDMSGIYTGSYMISDVQCGQGGTGDASIDVTVEYLGTGACLAQTFRVSRGCVGISPACTPVPSSKCDSYIGTGIQAVVGGAALSATGQLSSIGGLLITSTITGNFA